MARPGTAFVVARTRLTLRQALTIIIRIVSIAIAVIIHAVRAVAGLGRWRRTTIGFTVALVLGAVALAVATVTVNPAVDVVFRAFTLSVSTAIRL